MAISTININLKWTKKITDLSKCTACEEIIYSSLNKLTILADNSKDVTETKTHVKLCDSCFDYMEKQ